MIVESIEEMKALVERPEIVELGMGQYEWKADSDLIADDRLIVTPTSGPAGQYVRMGLFLRIRR